MRKTNERRVLLTCGCSEPEKMVMNPSFFTSILPPEPEKQPQIFWKTFPVTSCVTDTVVTISGRKPSELLAGLT